LDVELGDVRDPVVVRRAVRGVDRVFHFAAQVAVTTSLIDPLDDFRVNTEGTLRLLEALRGTRTPFLFTSTNKVYGSLPDVALTRVADRWVPDDLDGISEARPLCFCTPYGCSKGAADQYVLDYARSFGLPAVVFRMSCIYGPHQHGNEDQGWVAHFLLSALRGDPVVIYGDGAQVRDILFVDDLVDAMLAVTARADVLAGEAFNVGGGPDNTISLMELLDLIDEVHGSRPFVEFGAERPGDQRYYVSDTRKLGRAIAWKPRVGVAEGVGALYEWLSSARAAAAA
ncbi:MAG: NAD-dependent epimerase/dehydratase family protein, partial [Gaiellaceae bacterium]